MAFKETKIYAITKMKCPICHEGDLFIEKNPYKLKMLFQMHERCAVCGFKFEPETGFYYGAMYTSYGISITLSILIFLIYWFASATFDPIIYIAVNAVILFILFPLTFRISRSLWINLLYHYKPGPYNPHKH
jgi:hypothetical protein